MGSIPFVKEKTSLLLVMATLISGVLSACAPQPSAPPSDAPLWLFAGHTFTLAEDGREWQWRSDVYGSPSSTQLEAPIMCSDDSTAESVFLSPRGSERVVTQWTAWSTFPLSSDEHNVVQAALSLQKLSAGDWRTPKDKGGDFSLGVACLTNNNTVVTTALYRTISIKPGGNWTADPLKSN
jgi:hypothetical protein